MFGNKILLFVMTGLFYATNALAGPFGLEMGMSLQAIGGNPQNIKSTSGNYNLTNVPKPHSAFESYVVVVAPKSGLCQIRAMGEEITTSTFGVEFKSEFHKLKDQLEKSYGNT